MKKLLFSILLFCAAISTQAQTKPTEILKYNWKIWVYNGTPKPEPVKCVELIETPEGDWIAGLILVDSFGKYYHKSLVYCKEQVIRYSALR